MGTDRKREADAMTRRLFVELGAAALAALCLPGCLGDQRGAVDAAANDGVGDGADGREDGLAPDGNDAPDADDGGLTDGGEDAGSDSGADSGSDAGDDAGDDAGADAADDAGADAGDDAGADPADPDPATFSVNQSLCNGCGKCAPKCPAAAFVLAGTCDTHLKGMCYWQCHLFCLTSCSNSALLSGSQNPDQWVTIDKDKCICCGDCVPACPFGNIERLSDRLAAIDMDRCTRCGACVMPGYCPLDAITQS